MKVILILALASFVSCLPSTTDSDTSVVSPGANQTDQYLPLLQNKSIGLTVNHSSRVGDQLLIDTLVKQDQYQFRITRIFTPEHGFEGTLSDGEIVEYDSSASKLVSLYGKNKKPTPNQLADIDVMLFDLQDVGARFYTYISTLHLVMEACAEADVPIIILDRPNPNASYVDGPVLDTAFRSFVGMHPIPIVYGMTMGELAQMINGEGWLKDGLKCNLTVIKNMNWDHQTTYSLPIKPSPNLPNDLSIALYPSLCLFEGTVISVGRGTDYPFQQIGHPNYPDSAHSFIPIPNEGSKWPPHEGKRCFGKSYIAQEIKYSFTLQPVIDMYQSIGDTAFFNNYLTRLAGTDQLRKQIESGMSESEIRTTWQPDLKRFLATRSKYLLYD